jgi:hypothetical protein
LRENGEKKKYMRGETKNTMRKCTVREMDLRVEREIEGKMNNERPRIISLRKGQVPVQCRTKIQNESRKVKLLKLKGP